jgi:hemerythrin-like metal-binding protein
MFPALPAFPVPESPQGSINVNPNNQSGFQPTDEPTGLQPVVASVITADIEDKPMIPYVTWKDFYSVGDPSIDAQHKQILETINELYEAMQKGKDRAVLKPILDRLLQYTLAHFKHEEQVMLEHEYPNSAQHKALHDKIRQKTTDLREQAYLVTGQDLLRFLKEWWVGHIQGQDKNYSPYLEAIRN